MKSLLTSFLCLIAVSLLWAVSSCDKESLDRHKVNNSILMSVEHEGHKFVLNRESYNAGFLHHPDCECLNPCDTLRTIITHKNLTIERLKASSQDLKYEIELRDKEIERLKRELK